MTTMESLRRGAPEADIQRQIVQALRAVLPRGFVLHHSANEVRGGGDWARKQQHIAAGMGVHPGFADLILLADGKVVFLEVKTATGRASESQIRFCGAVESQGHQYFLVRSVQDALDALRVAGIKTMVRAY